VLGAENFSFKKLAIRTRPFMCSLKITKFNSFSSSNNIETRWLCKLIFGGAISFAATWWLMGKMWWLFDGNSVPDPDDLYVLGLQDPHPDPIETSTDPDADPAPDPAPDPGPSLLSYFFAS
jgi:hypothetical protein